MNKNNAAAYLPLVQALAEGKQLQCYGLPNSFGIWTDVDVAYFDIKADHYRIKPEEDYWSTSGAFITKPITDRMQKMLDEETDTPIPSWQEKIAQTSFDVEQEMTKDTPKVKRWYRVGLISGEPVACSTEQGEKSAEKYVGHRWLTDRIEYEVDG